MPLLACLFTSWFIAEALFSVCIKCSDARSISLSNSQCALFLNLRFEDKDASLSRNCLKAERKSSAVCKRRLGLENTAFLSVDKESYNLRVLCSTAAALGTLLIIALIPAACTLKS